MADEDNPINKVNHPITPQIQSTAQPRSHRSSRLNETPVSDSVRSLISQFNSPGIRQPEEINQVEQAINESQRILTRAYSNLTGRQPTELPLPQITRPRTRHPEPISREQEQYLGAIPDIQIQQSLTGTNHPSSSSGPPSSGGSGQPPSPPVDGRR